LIARLSILILSCLLLSATNGYCNPSGKVTLLNFSFYGDSVSLPLDSSFLINLPDSFSEETTSQFYQKAEQTNYAPLVEALLSYKKQYRLDDWLYYQVIRRTAQLISPKKDDYKRYTLYKWFLLAKSGYNTTLSLGNNVLLFYVQSDENIYEIPCHTKNNQQYACLNSHDYSNVDFEKTAFKEVSPVIPESQKSFSYKITEMPEFTQADYQEKNLSFKVNFYNYQFKIKLNKQIQNLFANYPVVDYSLYFNIPLSKETYQSLIPVIRKNIKHFSVKDGVDYLMRFTRYAFLFEPDTENFGKEKRLTPEQTLLFDHSDCEDRAALFFYLVKEMYDLPMIVLSYPKHVTIAVKFDKPSGTPIIYNGERYSVCEPTPQKEDLSLGELLPDLRKTPYEVVYAYYPKK